MINLEIAKSEDLTEISSLNEENILSLLGQIEEYLGYIKIFISEEENVDSPILRTVSSIIVETKEPDPIKSATIKDILDLKDLYHDPDIEDVRYPISIVKFKHRAKRIAASANLEEFVPSAS